MLGIFCNISHPTKSVTLLLDMIEICPITGFWEWKIIWNHFHKAQINLKAKNWVEGL